MRHEREKPQAFEECPFSATVYTTNPIWTALGENPGFRVQRRRYVGCGRWKQ
jgi:hypothetical protein